MPNQTLKPTANPLHGLSAAERNRLVPASACPESAVFSESRALYASPRVSQGLGHAGGREIV